MEANLLFYGNGDFSGIEFCRGNRSHTYYGDIGSDYRAFVVDCLNEDYMNIASECFNVPSALRQKLKQHEKQGDYIVCTGQNGQVYRYTNLAELLANGADPSQVDWEAETLWDTVYLDYDAITKDFAAFDYSFYREAIQKIYIDPEYETLSPIQKYYAFTRSQLTEKHRRFEPVSVLIQYEGDSYSQKEKKSGFELIPEVDTDYDTICNSIVDDPNDLRFSSGEVYSFASLSDVFIFLFHRMINENQLLGICQHCGRYFVPKRRNERYCSRPCPEDPTKTCLEYEKYKRYLDTTHEDAARLYKQIYNSMRNKLQRSGNHKIAEELACFKHQASTWKSQVKTGAKAEDDYIDWLYMVKNGL